jgi:mRNA interferase MazF
VKRFDVYLVSLDPTVGREMQKTRPSIIVSPDVMNRLLGTVIVAPMSTRIRTFPYRVSCRFQGKPGQIALDQLRTVDKVRLVKRLGQVSLPVQKAVLAALAELFAE